MSNKPKSLFKHRIKLMFCYVKIGILFIFAYLWLFSPGFLVLLLPKNAYVLGWLCIIGIYFNFRLSSEEDFIINKWSNKLESERNELRYAIWSEKALITAGNIKIFPFGKY